MRKIMKETRAISVFACGSGSKRLRKREREGDPRPAHVYLKREK